MKNEINGYAGLEYVVIKTDKKSIPFKTLLNLELDIARKILAHYPLRGKEISFLRKQIGLSCAKMSAEMNGDIDPSSISRLERKSEERLSPVNEVYFRTYFLEKLKVDMNAKRSVLLPSKSNEIIELAG